MDYDYNAVYVAYQYDLRTFVVGEGMKFDFTAALAGIVMAMMILEISNVASAPLRLMIFISLFLPLIIEKHNILCEKPLYFVSQADISYNI